METSPNEQMLIQKFLRIQHQYSLLLKDRDYWYGEAERLKARISDLDHHAIWAYDESGGIYCTYCGRFGSTINNRYKTNYCPHCGAKMDGDK